MSNSFESAGQSIFFRFQKIRSLLQHRFKNINLSLDLNKKKSVERKNIPEKLINLKRTDIRTVR